MEKVLPKGWVETELGTITTKPQYGWTTKSDLVGDFRYLRTTDIGKGKIKWKNVPFCVDLPENINQYLLEKNDILISRAGSIGLSYRVDENVENTLFASYLIRFKPLINPKLIAYFLHSRNYWKSISENAVGIAVQNINAPKLQAIPFPLPPLAEQERIVAKLDALFAQHEKMKAALARIPQLLKDFRQQVLTQAVTGKLTEQWREGKVLESGKEFLIKIIHERKSSLKKSVEFKEITNVFEIPSTWSFTYLQWVGEFTRGKSKHRPRNDKKLFNGPYPFIQTGDVSKAHMYINQYSTTYSEFGLQQSRLFPKGTLCITIAANIAETAILNFDACFPDSVVAYIPHKNLYTSEFAMYYLNTIQKELEQFAPATAQKNINMGILNEIPFPVPPLAEQQEIVNRVESLFAKADAIEARYEQLKQKIEALPQALLHKAFKGELVPQLPTDGDAKDLLAEIMALKKEMKGKKK